MGIFSNVLAGNTAKFIAHHIVRGLVKSSGHSARSHVVKQRNIQCIKLTKEHSSLTQMLMFWSNLCINKLQQLGVAETEIKKIVRENARFLTILNYAIATAGDEEHDTWLFFDNDVQSTDFFELQYCDRNTKLVKVSYTIRAEC